MNWKLTVQDPSGEKRTLAFPALSQSRPMAHLSNAVDADIPLRDPSLGDSSYRILYQPLDQVANSPFWIQGRTDQAVIQIGDLKTQMSELPPHITVRIGDTLLRMETKEEESIPSLPPHKPGTLWLSQNSKGKDLVQQVRKAAITPLSVYLEGETGTGKEMLAKMVHLWSPRVRGPFIPINCGALPLSLAESELFGHTKGAFTGAHRDRPGALLQAHGGTLFLDEIADLPMEIQVQLLRFLENGELRPVGSDTLRHADVRIVCATHKPLEDLVEQGKFRKDLYYRIASIPLTIPSLRERPEDIEFLARTFAKDFEKEISPRALIHLKLYDWPGNVRELRHILERACAQVGPFRSVLQEEDFDFLNQKSRFVEKKKPALPSTLNMKTIEKHILLQALRITQGHRGEAAKLMGVARSTLFEMLKRHKVPRAKNLYWEEALN